ncbi:MAG: tetratricopeptide repeat protein, partial [Phycisphaerales bacterium]|nr:tetratricopeptide repeat protein [Phycisphaerales bacterium]
LFPVDETPTDVLLRIASVSHQIASARIETALADMDPAVRDIVDIDPGVKYEANVHLKRAGDYYVRHARALRATPEGDEAWAQSLWWGADSYDLAGWYDLAITHFKEYLAGTQGEARRPEATFRIAQGYHALQDYPSALEYYQRVLGEHPNSTFAGRSYVPLARCQAATGDYAAAEASLQHVLGGSAHSIEPDAVDYREAQIDSGKLFYAQGKFVPAIEALDKALRRYPDDPRVNALRYTLADAYRQQSLKVGADMETAVLPGSELERLDEMRRSYLASAADLFDQVRAAYEARNAHHLQRFEQDMLRAAYLYRGDCAFLLGRLREAIEIYGETARKYSQHHSSMLALIQIVECYHRLGQTEQARIAHLRALRRLEELPDEAFSEPDSLLDRATWERWLQNTPLGSVARVPEGTTP